MRMKTFSLAAAALLALTSGARAADVYGMDVGTPELKSAGPLAFGAQGILFIADPVGSSIYAVKTGEQGGVVPNTQTIKVEGLTAKLNAALGIEGAQVSDLVANPESGSVYVAVNVTGKPPRIVKVARNGDLSEMKLENISFSKSDLPNVRPQQPAGAAPAAGGGGGQRAGRGGGGGGGRGGSITDIAYANGLVLVSGASATNQASSNVWTLYFPFQKADQGANVEIYHGNHGAEEANSPMTTFVPFMINGEPNILAGYVCTPLVKFPVKQLDAANAEKVKGTTLAELGNRNVPLDMIAYNKGGKDFLLITNSARGVMKVSTEGLDRSTGITSRVPNMETAGQKFETIEGIGNVVQLDKLNDTQAVAIVSEGENLTLKTVDLP